MAVYTYSVTASDVADEMPGVDGSSIDATSEPVSTSNLTTWIADGASNLNALLDRSGITPDANLDEDTHQKLADAVKAFATFKALHIMGVTGAVLEDARGRYNTVYAEISNSPQSLGDAYDDGLTLAVDTDTNAEAWSFIDNEGQNW